MYLLKDFLMMDSNLDAMKEFYLRYVRAVVTTKKFDYTLLKQPLCEGMEISTASDDAFALVAIKNSEHVWLDVLERSNGEV